VKFENTNRSSPSNWAGSRAAPSERVLPPFENSPAQSASKESISAPARFHSSKRMLALHARGHQLHSDLRRLKPGCMPFKAIVLHCLLAPAGMGALRTSCAESERRNIHAI